MDCFETTLKPIVFAVALGDGRFYVSISRNLNETLAKWRVHEGPLWVRKFKFDKILEVEPCGSKHSLILMTIKYIAQHGETNVRSALPGHSSIELDSRPKFVTEFITSYEAIFNNMPEFHILEQ
jgi:hypothetical protein